MFVIGAGALGSLLGGLLAQKGETVVFFDRNGDKRNAIEDQGGVVIAGPKGEVLAPATAVSFPLPQEKEPVLLCVKAQDILPCLQNLNAYIERDQPICILANGMGWQEEAAQICVSGNLCFGLTYQGAHLLAPGRVAHAGSGDTILYGYTAIQEAAASFWAQHIKGAFAVRVEKQFQKTLWEKLLINAVINPLTALGDIENGQLPLVQDIVPVMLGLLREGMEVAGKCGVDFSLVTMMDKTVQVCADTAGNTSSMRADVLRGHKTEIDYLNGYIVKMGQKFGIKTPLQEQMVVRIKEISA